jgi:hypothetical protein
VKTLQIRELTGIEEDILASNMPMAKKMTAVMANCTMKAGDFLEKVKIDEAIRKATITDRWHLLIALRVLSLGSDYVFKATCPHCGKEDELHFDLNKIAVKKAPKADVMFHEIDLPSGLKARLKIGTGETEEKIEQMSKDQTAATVGIYARLAEINGKPPSFSEVQQLPMKDRNAIRAKIEELEGELDDEYTQTCIGCGREWKAELPLEGRSFFSQ